MGIESLHKKIEYYLIENQKEYFPFSIIGNEVICNIIRKNRWNISLLKLDLLGADENYFYIIEIKTRELTMAHIEKYEKTYNNFNCLDKEIKIIFVVPSINKKAKEYIENLDRYKVIYISELEKLNNYTINNELQKIPSSYALDEYRISFLLSTFFDKFNSYIWDFKFGNARCGESFSSITYKFKNDYRVNLYIGKDNICLVDTIFNALGDKSHYPWIITGQFNYEVAQMIYMRKLMEKIKRIPSKRISFDEFENICDIATNDTYKELEDDNNFKKYKNLYKTITQTFTKHYKYELR
ncbi:hypothetical protein HBE96_23490 [Clostridium sp. P21]|uniref:Uncharacterized protein n=1 Tax=Clostridium muellerianum TaxID=2716538 RepID=A0A7Y0ENF0_9CLOT|nr:hypothetical protein [Clostridium muellerianum]NMM65545.1 hypothetical protein [Clostridium muellerianum]